MDKATNGDLATTHYQRLLPSTLCPCNTEWVGELRVSFRFIVFPVENIPPSSELSLLSIARLLFASNRFSPFKVIFHMQFDYSCVIFLLHILNIESSLQLDFVSSSLLSLVPHHSKGTEVFPILGHSL